MPNIRLDLAGKTFGCLTVLSYDEASFGGHDSRWVCVCNNCQNTHSVRGYNVKKSPASCARCKMKYRTYPIVELPCGWCGCSVKATNRKHVAYCSKACRNKVAAARTAVTRTLSVEDCLKAIYVGAKSRAKRNKKEFSISLEWLQKLLVSQGGRCPRTGVVLQASKPHRSHRSSPHTISIDRIDSTLGYTESNVELVSFAYNSAKGAFSAEEFYELCKQVVHVHEEQSSS